MQVRARAFRVGGDEFWGARMRGDGDERGGMRRGSGRDGGGSGVWQSERANDLPKYAVPNSNITNI